MIIAAFATVEVITVTTAVTLPNLAKLQQMSVPIFKTLPLNYKNKPILANKSRRVLMP